MRLLTFAAGLAAGYVLGTRAGREKYEQIVDKTRQLRTHPTVVRAQQKVSNTISQSQPAASRGGTPTPGVDDTVATPVTYTDPLAQQRSSLAAPGSAILDGHDRASGSGRPIS